MEFVNTFWALVPAIVAIVLALITKEDLHVPCSSASWSAPCCWHGFRSHRHPDYIISGTVVHGGRHRGGRHHGGLDSAALADPWNAGIFMFLVMLGIMVALINAARRASAAFGAWAAQATSRRRIGAQLATVRRWACLIFVDDYFNCLDRGLRSCAP